ncbi:MAG: N(6)-L-threonylcarbamoyladenine synthase Kae1 [Candidatus Aenigmarchaeota archaeon]|nr:N(6)-L-threonylcarbamoyladenine synthase Kae1 [Candidatus Aenigmarchaeota archaeon]
MIALGIEGTAHTFGVGIVEDTTILANAKRMYAPPKGTGIHPALAAQHHQNAAAEVLETAIREAGVALDAIDVLAYAAGPGLPPCLKVTSDFAGALQQKTGKPLMAVNHCIAHIEIGRMLCGATDPIVMYVSGGNTQILGYSQERYRVFGETQDIAIGNAIDTFMRHATGEFPGGPPFDKLAAEGTTYVELPYIVKGMDLSFSGMLTAALRKHRQGASLADVCYSMQETAFAMLTEVTERALAHAGKNEVLVAGGVAASQRFNEMLRIMCSERGASCFSVSADYARDNGAMIAWTGLLAHRHGQQPVERADFFSRWRTDEVEVLWFPER